MLSLLADEHYALERLRRLLSQDPLFEHLEGRSLNDVTWRFACLTFVQRDRDLVTAFVEEHGREPAQRTCFFPVDLLSVNKEVSLYGVKIVPPAAIDVPPVLLGPDPRTGMGAVLAVECAGTSYTKMEERARGDAEQALRLLRATLREHRWIPDRQLRFRLGTAVWFDDSRNAGWSHPIDEGWSLELTDELIQVAASQPLSTLPVAPTNDVEQRVARALQWFERAQLAVDPLMELLALFFALETILGDRAEGKKAAALAMRRAMLGLLTSGHFRHPSDTYSLYDEVRSKAVHGDEPPRVGQRDVDSFASDVREALNEFLQFARENGFTRRSHVREALDTDEQRADVVEALLKEDAKRWGEYLGLPTKARRG